MAIKTNTPSALVLLKKIVEGTSSGTGQKFFDDLVKSLSELLDVSGVWVTEYLATENRLRAISFYLNGKFVDEYEYQVSGTPCEPVVNSNQICHFPEKVIELFPLDPDLEPLGAVSYMGLAMRDPGGTVLGHLAVLDSKPMAELPEYYSIMEIFTARATAELRRLKLTRQFEENKIKLERLLNGISEGVLEFNQNLQLVQCNLASQQMFGLKKPDDAGKNVLDFFDQQGQGQITRDLLRLNQEVQNTIWIDSSICAIGKDGRSFPVQLSLSSYLYQQARYFTLFVRNIEEQVKSEESIQQLNMQKKMLEEKVSHYDFGQIIGLSAKISEALEMVSQVASSDTTVLITGETGTGKELFAQAVHKASSRKNRPLIALNCAALPKELIESELFGHVKGAFTGAMTAREGRFSLAHRGTIFLDEIGELPLELQAKLLRVLQEGEFEPLGSASTKKVDVRVIAATNRDLFKEVTAGRFREDLYYRLNVFPIHIPPLRDRQRDVILLAEAFMQKFAGQKGKFLRNLTEKDKQLLMAYHWPGNVRELQNVVERCVILSRDHRVDFESVLPSVNVHSAAINSDDEVRILTNEEMRAIEVLNIQRALEKANWKIYGKDGAAHLLNIPHTTLNSRLKKLGIRRK